jgi:hypothetical protein
MATDVKPAGTITPGPGVVPTTGQDETALFLGLHHWDYFDDDVTDEEQKKEKE